MYLFSTCWFKTKPSKSLPYPPAFLPVLRDDSLLQESSCFKATFQLLQHSRLPASFTHFSTGPTALQKFLPATHMQLTSEKGHFPTREVCPTKRDVNKVATFATASLQHLLIVNWKSNLHLQYIKFSLDAVYLLLFHKGSHLSVTDMPGNLCVSTLDVGIQKLLPFLAFSLLRIGYFT